MPRQAIKFLFTFFCWFIFSSCGGGKTASSPVQGSVQVICECRQEGRTSFVKGAGASRQSAEANAQNKCQTGSVGAAVENCELMTPDQA